MSCLPSNTSVIALLLFLCSPVVALLLSCCEGPSLTWLHHPMMVTEFTADSSLETVLRVLHRTH